MNRVDCIVLGKLTSPTQKCLFSFTTCSAQVKQMKEILAKEAPHAVTYIPKVRVRACVCGGALAALVCRCATGKQVMFSVFTLSTCFRPRVATAKIYCRPTTAAECR